MGKNYKVSNDKRLVDGILERWDFESVLAEQLTECSLNAFVSRLLTENDSNFKMIE